MLTGKADNAGQRLAAALVTSLLLVTGWTLIALALLADHAWLDRHLLPHMFIPYERLVLLWSVERGLALLVGIVLILWVRRWLVRAIREGKGRELAIQAALILLAIALSCVVSEIVLRTVFRSTIERWSTNREPLQMADRYLGWRFVPARTGSEAFNGHTIVYHFDRDGHRVASPSQPVDYRRPSILFTGESIMVGFRLNWAESIAGQVQALSRIQAANMAVNGYNPDQIHMRLAQELPRFERPVAVVTLFSPALLERMLIDNHPRLDAALRWHPAQSHMRLAQFIAKDVFPFRRESTIDRGIATAQGVLRATVAAARARGAEPLILVPSFSPEPEVEARLRQRILDAAGLPYLLVLLDPSWRLPRDGHPDARADRAMALAVVDRLRARRPDLFARR